MLLSESVTSMIPEHIRYRCNIHCLKLTENVDIISDQNWFWSDI